MRRTLQWRAAKRAVVAEQVSSPHERGVRGVRGVREFRTPIVHSQKLGRTGRKTKKASHRCEALVQLAERVGFAQLSATQSLGALGLPAVLTSGVDQRNRTLTRSGQREALRHFHRQRIDRLDTFCVRPWGGIASHRSRLHPQVKS